MLKGKNKQYFMIFCWLLVIVCMVIIFIFSSRTATESAAESSKIVIWLKSVFGDGIFTDFIVRKMAHCLEFTGLSLLTSLAIYATNGKSQPVSAVILSSAYAITDEVHQLFVEGRACQVRDWAIDTLGAILGAFAFALIFTAISSIIKNKARKDLTQEKFRL